jgi:hypothetical protein
LKLIAALLGIATAVAAGIGLGSIPMVNENLHWNIWVVVPVSGALVGVAFGAIQFQVVRLLDTAVRSGMAAILAVGCMAGYAATEVGIYYTDEIEVVDSRGRTEGIHPIRSVMSFEDYLDRSLAGSSYGGGPNDRSGVSYERTGTMITWAVDLGGALLASFFTLLGFAGQAPFCNDCDRYKKPNQKLKIVLAHDPATELLDALHERVAQSDYAGLITVLIEGDKNIEPPKSDQAFRIQADERVCPGCSSATVMGTVEVNGKKGWAVVNELEFRLASQPGETARLTRG